MSERQPRAPAVRGSPDPAPGGTEGLQTPRPNLSVELAGTKMRNPVMPASGTFGFGKELCDLVAPNSLGALVTKGTSLDPWPGNPYPRTVETPAGMLNAIGLQNDGVRSFIEDKLPWLRRFDVPVIVNIIGKTVEEYAEVARILDHADGMAALEINISCPNIKEGGIAFGCSACAAAEVVRAVREATRLPIIPKLSPNVADIVEMAKAVVDAGADALCLINTLLGTAVDPWTRQFKLANITGGLSGPAIKPIALRMVWEVHKADLGVPIIGVGGVMTAADAVEFLLVGATAVQVGTATFVNPCAINGIIAGLVSHLEKMGVADVGELIGAATGP